MNGLAFFDTNILVYAEDKSEPKKRARARQLYLDHQRRNSSVISLQVMQEYFAIATRKLKISTEQAQRVVEVLAKGRVARLDSDDVIAAIELHRLTRISFWDALIVQAAKIAGAAILYSEDMQHGAVLGGVKIVNPFLEAAN